MKSNEEITLWGAMSPSGSIVRGSLSPSRAIALRYAMRKRNHVIAKLGTFVPQAEPLPGFKRPNIEAGELSQAMGQEAPEQQAPGANGGEETRPERIARQRRERLALARDVKAQKNAPKKRGRGVAVKARARGAGRQKTS